MRNVPRILIVDDEVDTCANLCDIFADLGYDVDTAHDGLAALRLVDERRFDIALLDLRMSGMNGLELFRRIADISPNTVAIVVTAYASGDAAQSMLDAGACRLLPKPVNVSKLLNTVSELAHSTSENAHPRT